MHYLNFYRSATLSTGATYSVPDYFKRKGPSIPLHDGEVYPTHGKLLEQIEFVATAKIVRAFKATYMWVTIVLERMEIIVRNLRM
jgi:hypothetical protein